MNIKFTFDEINDTLTKEIYNIINNAEMNNDEKEAALNGLDYNSNELIDTLASIVSIEDSFLIKLENEVFNAYWEYALPALIRKCLDMEKTEDCEATV